MAEYYCLVSGLVEYALEADHKGFNARGIREDIQAQVAKQDAGAVALLYAFYDVENVIAHLAAKESFNALGEYTAQEIAHALDPQSDQESELRPLPEWITHTISNFHTQAGGENPDQEQSEEGNTCTTLEAALWGAFYGECARSRCTFVREWFDFDMTVRNLCAAFTARAKGLPVAEQLVGWGEVVQALRESSAADFGLRNEIEYIEGIVALLEMKNILEKEHRLDLIRWAKADELTTFNYFDINTILAYLVKINIIHRWVSLDRQAGEKMLKQLLRELTNKEVLTKKQN